MNVHSRAALIAGLGFGLMLLASGYGVWRGSRESLVASAIIAALVVVTFTVRVVKTRRFMPAGVLALPGVVTLVIFLSRLMQGWAARI